MAVITKERQAAVASELQRVVSQIDFTAFDFFSIKQALIQYLKINYPNEFNDFIESSAMMAMIEEIAYLGELIAYRVDMTLQEGSIVTASDRQSLIDRLRLINYYPSRAFSASGEVTLAMQIDSTTGLPVTDSTYIAGLPRWIFNPELSSSTIISTTDLTTNGVYQTLLDNHLPFEVTVGSETLTYELTSTTYQNGLEIESHSVPRLSLVFDGTWWRCVALQGKTVQENFTQEIAEANLEYVTTYDNADNTTPIVTVAGDIWTYTTALYLPDPQTTLRFSTKHDANDRLSILFGDGIASAIPLGNVSVLYRITDGLKGNIPSSGIQNIVLTKVLSNPSAGGKLETVQLRINAVSAISGGKDRETIDEMRRHAPSFSASQNRQVSGSDYIVAALEQPNVAMAKAVLRTFVGHDATGTYSSATQIGMDAIGNQNSIQTKTDFSGAVPGIDTIHRVDSSDLNVRHTITKTAPGATATDPWTIYTTADRVLAQGTAATGSSTTILIDTTATFITSGIKPGMGVFNVTDSSWGVVQSVDSETQITLQSALQGGTANTFAVGDTYRIQAWPFTWSGYYVWEHWAGSLDGSTYFVSDTTGAGTASFPGVVESHISDSAYIYLIDHYTGEIFTASKADFTFNPSPLSASVSFKNVDGTVSTFTPTGQMTMVVDFSYQSQSTWQIPTTPAPDPSGAFIYAPAGDLNPGDVLHNGVHGFLILDIERNNTTVGSTVYDKVFLTRNVNYVLAAGEILTRIVMRKNVTTLQNPSKTNIIDLYIVAEDSSGYPIAYPTDTVTLTEINKIFEDTSMVSDNVFVQWGVVKKLPIDLTVHLKPNVLNTTELQNKIQQAVFEFFKLGRFEFGESFKVSRLVSYLHTQFAEIDYIDHTALNSLDPTAKPNEVISIDLNHRGVTVV